MIRHVMLIRTRKPIELNGFGRMGVISTFTIFMVHKITALI